MHLAKKYLKIIFPVISPNNKWKLSWDILFAFFILFSILYTPFELSFKQNHIEFFNSYFKNFLSIYKCLKIIFFFIEIILNFNLAYFKKGVLITKRKNIAYNYLKSRFLLDILLLLIFLIFNNDDNFMEIIIIFCYSKMVEILNTIV